MRGLLLTLLLALAFAASAVAPAFAVTDTLTHSAPWRVGSNWSAGHPPTVEEKAVIPSGVTVVVDKAVTSGPLTVEPGGEVDGAQPLTVFGAVTIAPESFELTNTLDLKGWGTVRAEDTIYYLRLDGNETLAAPLHAGILTAYRRSTLATDGYPVTVDTETYPFEEADWLLGASTFTTGYWLAIPPSLGGEIHAEHASLVITGSGGGLEGVMKCEGWTYGAVTFTGEGQIRGNCTIAGALTVDGPTTIESGRTVHVGSLATDGTAEAPERLSATGASLAVVECGCSVPAGLALENVEVR